MVGMYYIAKYFIRISL